MQNFAKSFVTKRDSLRKCSFVPAGSDEPLRAHQIFLVQVRQNRLVTSLINENQQNAAYHFEHGSFGLPEFEGVVQRVFGDNRLSRSSGQHQ
jgi:hypothetical protein